MTVVTIQPEGNRVLASPGRNIIEILNEEGVNIENICGGRGVCQKMCSGSIRGEIKRAQGSRRRFNKGFAKVEASLPS